jgi:hypothetical protein
MRYELLYYELKEKKFNSKKTLEKFLNTLAEDQKLRLIRKDNNVSYLLIRTRYGFED